MAQEVIWTPNATRDLADTISFLESEWSFKVADSFLEEILQRIKLIQQFPSIGTPSKRNPAIRKVLVTKHVMLLYAVAQDHIVLLNIFNTRSQGYSENT